MNAAAETTPKWIYAFGDGGADGDASMRELLGGKGANLAEMARLGLPVPPGFTITTDVCAAYYTEGRKLPAALIAQVDAAMAELERRTGKRFGDTANPLLVSVRSGGRASMPGMMDTVLNLGLNRETTEGLAAQSGDARFARDSYRRFIQMYSNVVLGIRGDVFEHILDDYKETQELRHDTELEADDWATVIEQYLEAVERHNGSPFPQDPRAQLHAAIAAVFGSWMSRRAIDYRRLNDIPESWGTAVNVQAMVFGNLGKTSATGVAFTRNPSTGEHAFYGEFLVNAQGEDVVAGIRTPAPISIAGAAALGSGDAPLETVMPEVFAELVKHSDALERHYRDMQDIEFTVEKGRLFILQCRNGKRTAAAALRLAVEMANEGVLSKEEALMRVDPAQLDQLLHPTIAPDADRDVLVRGLPASPGAASGKVVFTADEALAMAERGEAVILVRTETSPEDVHGMHAAKGIVTARGGMTSHAAVVARGMGRPCVSGAGGLQVDEHARVFRAAGRQVNAGEIITVDGASGEVMLGELPMIEPDLSGDFGTLMDWADEVRRMRVRANAETPEDAETAARFGADGIGLCRTEHMFFDSERIPAVRAMILAETEAGRKAALDKLLPYQRGDFLSLYRVMAGKPVTIRLLDPPLHEFLPHNAEDIAAVSRVSGLDAVLLTQRAAELHESNPMLGHRGCRLAITSPEIYEMQARAIAEAAVDAAVEGIDVPEVEIMVPLVAAPTELAILRERIETVVRRVMAERGTSVAYRIGTMIELPRAALLADEIAVHADFFSFGTNDLTQTTLGISRDDAGRFLKAYSRLGIFEKDPFVTLDQKGVGTLVQMATTNGRATREGLKVGLCGEHGGDPDTIGFCEGVGLDYVSCSPFRVPIARLAAAQASLKARGIASKQG